MKHRIVFLDMPIRKVLEGPCLLFPEKSAKRFQRETERETEFTARGEYATVHISPDCSKYVFELESVCVSDDFKLHTFGGENGTLAVTRPTGGGVQRGATGG